MQRNFKMPLIIHICFFTNAILCAIALGSHRREEEPHYYHKWWNWKSQQHSYGYQKRNQPDFFHGFITPYRLLGKPPVWTRKPPGCKAVQLYTIFRHGERNPSWASGFVGLSPLEPLEKVLNPLIRKKSIGISPSVDIKFPWKSPYIRKEDLLQVPEGDKQIYNIGSRFAKRFSEIFNGRFSIADYNFTSSYAARASQTATAFGMGYLKGKGHVTKLAFQPIPLTTYPRNNDKLHGPQPNCKRWRETVSRNPLTFTEYNKFLKTEKFQRIVRKVREKLGLKGVKEVDENLVLSMFGACGWGVQKFGYSQNSRWCSLFNKEDQKVFDFAVDMYLYYLMGPGNEINMKLACPQLQDIFDNILAMSGKTKRDGKRKFIGRFGHGGTILAPAYILGLFIDSVPLRADNYEQMRDRKFKFGNIAPMSGSIAFVLYRCSYGQYKIQFYHNERLVKLPACWSKVSCPLDIFVSYYKPILDKCNYNQACGS